METAGGKVPSGRVVKDIVQRIMERTKVPNPYRVGEVCQIIPKDNPELKGKGGYWCIVSEVHDFSCTVTAWDGEYTIALQHLKSKEYSDAECEEMRKVSLRISRLYSADMESAGRAVLKSLGELRRPYPSFVTFVREYMTDKSKYLQVLWLSVVNPNPRWIS